MNHNSHMYRSELESIQMIQNSVFQFFRLTSLGNIKKKIVLDFNEFLFDYDERFLLIL